MIMQALAKPALQLVSSKGVADSAKQLSRSICSCGVLLTRRRGPPARKPDLVRTTLDEQIPDLAVRGPQLTSTNPKLPRHEWRKRVAELQAVRRDPVLEKLARTRKLFIDLDEVQREWRTEYGFKELTKLCSFYKIDRDLFDGNPVCPRSWLDVDYASSVQVHRGNFLAPLQVVEAPSLKFASEADKLYSLVLTNLDGHVAGDKEVVLWLLANMSGSDVSTAEVVYPYLPPAPWKGTGHHRVVFCIFEHRERLDTSSLKTRDVNTLSGRTFSTPAFLKCQAGDATLHGISWFQTEWDESVSKTCDRLKDLNGEPIFDWEPYVSPKEEKRVLKTEYSEMRYRNM